MDFIYVVQVTLGRAGTLSKKGSFINLHLLQRNEKHRHLTLLTLRSLFSVHGNIMCSVDGNIIIHGVNTIGVKSSAINYLGDTEIVGLPV